MSDTVPVIPTCDCLGYLDPHTELADFIWWFSLTTDFRRDMLVRMRRNYSSMVRLSLARQLPNNDTETFY